MGLRDLHSPDLSVAFVAGQSFASHTDEGEAFSFSLSPSLQSKVQPGSPSLPTSLIACTC